MRVPHVLDGPAVLAALEEVAFREFTLASGESRTGGLKMLTYHTGRRIFTVKETTAPDVECNTANTAAEVYSAR